jgi:hypothetical protein
MQMVHKGGEPAEAMTMKSHVISRRIGECSAAELADRGK